MTLHFKAGQIYSAFTLVKYGPYLKKGEAFKTYDGRMLIGKADITLIIVEDENEN